MSNRLKSPDTSVIKPGFGSNALHIGQTESEVIAFLGKPESRTRKYEGQYFYNYPNQGLEVDFGKRGGRVEYIFYFREGVRGNAQANVGTDCGIRLGDTKEHVLKAYGDPDEQGAPVVLNSGSRFGEWFRYRAGINFQFGADERVDMITVTSADVGSGRRKQGRTN